MNEILDNKDLDSATWTKIKAHYIARRQSLLEKIAGDLSDEDTEKLRGRIRECNYLLKLEERREDDKDQSEF